MQIFAQVWDFARIRHPAVEVRGVDVGGDFSGFARLDHFVEVGDRATAARLGSQDLQIGVAGVLDHKGPLQLVALRDFAVLLDWFDERQARSLLLGFARFGRVGLRRLGLRGSDARHQKSHR